MKKNLEIIDSTIFSQYITEIISPLDQFKIFNLLSIDLAVINNIQMSITNIGLYLSIGSFILILLLLLATNYNKIISNR